MITIRRGTIEDTEAFISFLYAIQATMEHKEWFYLDSPQEIQEMMSGGIMALWLAEDEGRLVGAFDALYPKLDAYNYGYLLGYSENDLQRVVNMDTAAVHPDYRGKGLQAKLMQYAETEIQRSGDRILLCTVHPDNQYSLHNVLKQGYRIEKTLPMYGSLRHVLKK